MLKRIFDISVCIVLMPVVLVLVVLTGLIYLVFEREMPIFLQRRVGRDERVFTLVKLRTMKSSTAEMSTHEVGGSSVTRIGKFLRRTKLDELPQLWNVFVGHMSLVGPRPGLCVQEQLLVERRNLGVFAVRPGITGQSQIAGIDMSDPKKLALSDADYISRASFLTDLKILILTAFGRGAGDKIKVS